MKKFPQSLDQKLEQRREENSIRSLPGASSLIDFSSNDYIGFAKSAYLFQQAHELLQQRGIKCNGATGSRLISGNYQLHEEVENYIASFHQATSSLIFNSGYDANVGVFSSVPQKGDVVLYDEYIHASIRDGIRLSTAKAYKFKHNDTITLEKIITRLRNECRELYIAVESVFSMDGDLTPLNELVTLCEKYGCRLIVDEAHALGVRGNKGEGLAQQLGLQNKIFARIVTFGKGLGCHGAAVLGSNELKEYLVNFARSFIYTTALPPHSLATILASYVYLANEGSKEVNQLKNSVSFFTQEVQRLSLGNLFIPGTSAIHCAVLSGNERVRHISSVLQKEGYNVKPILSPTVPQGYERLRFCLHSYNTEEEIMGVLNALNKALR